MTSALPFSALRRDVRARLIDAALRYAENEDAIRDRTARMREARCESTLPCWVADAREAWKDHEAAIPDDYCEACQRSTILARERHALKRMRGARKEGVLRAAADFKGSIYGACQAGPAAGSGVINADHSGEPPCISMKQDDPVGSDFGSLVRALVSECDSMAQKYEE